MKRTTNYDFCLCESGDAVKRTDFNEDNAKIDAELARVEGTASTAPVLLATAQLESEAHTLTMDVSHIDLSQYDELRLVVPCGGTTQSNLCLLQVNGVNSGTQYGYNDGNSDVDADYILLGYSQEQARGNSIIDTQLYGTPDNLLLISHSVCCSGMYVNAKQYSGAAPFCNFATLDALTILFGFDNAHFAVGTHMRLFGYKLQQTPKIVCNDMLSPILGV